MGNKNTKIETEIVQNKVEIKNDKISPPLNDSNNKYVFLEISINEEKIGFLQFFIKKVPLKLVFFIPLPQKLVKYIIYFLF
jgi:hypothetical protein